jgi:membrane fusion protein (multidrug efflux system)
MKEDNMKRFYLKQTVTAVLLSLAFFITACAQSESGSKPEKENQGRAVQVAVTEVQPSPIRDVLILPGETEAWQDVCVASDTGGRVEWVGPKEGDMVKEGDLLAKVDVSSLKVTLEKAEAALKLADDLYQRRRQLFDRKIINQEELDRAATERTLAEGNLKQAKVEYERGFTRSPITGCVNHLYLDQGEYVDRGKPLADMVNVDRIKINVNVPELDVRYLKVGQTVAVKVDAFPDQSIEGRIDFVAYKADAATKTFHVKVLIDNPSHRIRPGMIARVAFLKRVIPDALVSPIFALVDKGGERMVFIEKDGIVHARTISIGVIEGDRVQIAKGLEPGDHLIVTGQTEVEEGMRVQVK